jgi:hypothetical protein
MAREKGCRRRCFAPSRLRRCSGVCSRGGRSQGWCSLTVLPLRLLQAHEEEEGQRDGD